MTFTDNSLNATGSVGFKFEGGDQLADGKLPHQGDDIVWEKS